MICDVLAMGKQHLGPHVVVGYGIKIFGPGLFITSPDHLVDNNVHSSVRRVTCFCLFVRHRISNRTAISLYFPDIFTNRKDLCCLLKIFNQRTDYLNRSSGECTRFPFGNALKEEFFSGKTFRSRAQTIPSVIFQ